jgi:phage tail-like protein
MADNDNQQGATWPTPKFLFEVDLTPTLKGIPFQEASGMDPENQAIEYRKSESPFFSTIKMPGIVKYAIISLKRGIFVNNNDFWVWRNQIAMSTVKKETILIRLLDENGKITMQWQLINAWPTKITSTDLKSDGNEIAVEAIEITHEQLLSTDASSSN